ncbi:unnamed protein product [Prorocentrum cordatum]|uniref:Uncharacterized protein n=1 Tax=Prorocentrum cordatum TaxID=2364126 RepID=A0ABN9Y3Z5_9DINO|nr:unnamed protein product [Polarella glacialis]
MLLSKDPGARAVPPKQLLERFARVEAGDWAPLLAPPGRRRSGGDRGRPPAGSDEELSQRCARAHALVQQGEVSAARQVLTANTIAPGTEATLAELRGPARRLAEPRGPLREDLAAVAPEPSWLESDKLQRNLRGCRRGAAPGPHFGIGVNMGKTKVCNAAGAGPPDVRDLGTEQDRVWVGDTAAPPHEQGAGFLVTPVGHAAFVCHHMRPLLADHRVLLHRLCQVGDLQTAWLLLSMCANPRANFYWRAMAPKRTRSSSRQPTTSTWKKAVTDLLGAPEDELATRERGREVAQLPLCLGALGLRCAVRMAPAASWASWADCLLMLQERAPAFAADTCRALYAGASGLPPGLRQAAEARVFTVLPTSEPMRVPPAELRVLLLRCLRLDVQFAAGACSGGESGGEPFLRDLNVNGVGAGDGRRLEVIASGAPLWGGAQLAVDAALVWPLGRGGAAHPRAADEGGAWLREARGRKQIACPELLGARRCGLLVLGLEAVGRRSQEALQFVRLLADCKARPAPELLRASAKAAWIQLWTGLASEAAQRAFAASLLHLPLDHALADAR